MVAGRRDTRGSPPGPAPAPGSARGRATQQPEGFWVKPGPGYTPKYRGTVWQLTFLGQMGADGTDARVQAACDYVLSHSQARTGGFASWEGGNRPEAPPPPSLVIHCLNGNLLRALIGFGRLADERVQRSIDWQARSITGEDFSSYYLSGTSGPGFCCSFTEQLLYWLLSISVLKKSSNDGSAGFFFVISSSDR